MRKNIIMEWAFGALGIIFLAVAGIWGYHTAAFIARADKVPGTVVDHAVSDSYRSIFVYEHPPGTLRRQVSSVGTNPPAQDVGEKVTVLVDPADPERAEIRSFVDQWIGPVIFGVFALLFGGLGFGLKLWRARREAWEEMVIGHGEKIAAAVTKVELNRSIRVNRRHPWRIFAEGTIAGEAREFRSINLWEDPTPHLASGKVDVYYLPHRPKEYCLDVRFLPERRERVERGGLEGEIA